MNGMDGWGGGMGWDGHVLTPSCPSTCPSEGVVLSGMSVSVLNYWSFPDGTKATPKYIRQPCLTMPCSHAIAKYRWRMVENILSGSSHSLTCFHLFELSCSPTISCIIPTCVRPCLNLYLRLSSLSVLYNCRKCLSLVRRIAIFSLSLHVCMFLRLAQFFFLLEVPWPIFISFPHSLTF